MILLGVTLTANAQGFTKGNIYVHNNGEMHVAANNFEFGTSGTTGTTRTTVYGKLSFAAAATWTSATNTHHVNGYVRTYKGDGSRFVFPVGNGAMYAPAAAKTNVTTGVDAAYLRQDPASDTSTDGSGTVTATPKPSTTFNSTTLDKVSSIEYWHIVGTKTEISLTWRPSSNISSTLTNSLADLTIAGWDGSQWVAVDSEVDVTSILTGASSLTAGSITSKAGATLTYTYYTLAAKGGACMPIVAASGNTRTWNGSWDTAPTDADAVVIASSGAPGSFACYSLSLGSNNLTINDGEVVDVVTDVTSTTGKIIMSSESSFVQRLGSATAPNIELTKLSRNTTRWHYTYWSSPLQGNSFSQLSNAHAESLSLPTPGAFGNILYWDPTQYNTVNTNDGVTNWQTAGTNWFGLSATTPGKGFAAQTKSQQPFTSGLNSNYITGIEKIRFPFAGQANNGDITVSTGFEVLGAAPGINSRYNLLGNPYPSAISADKFLDENRDELTPVVYFWTNQTTYYGQSTPFNEGYNTDDYATYVPGTGGTAAPTGGPTPTGNIASTQGFMTRRDGTFAANGGAKDVLFNNCMRVYDSGSNNMFFRISDIEPVIDRYWVNLTLQNGPSRQILVGYSNKATNDYDAFYDGQLFSVSANKFYSLIGNGRYAVNGRGAFVNNDVVPLGIVKPTTQSQTYTFSLQDAEGIFENNFDIYIHDKQLNVYHNLSESNYTFTTNITIDNSRFEIVYQTNALSNPDFIGTSVVMMLNNSMFSIQAKESIESIEIYDISGRIIEKYSVGNSTEFSKSFIHEEGIYIAKARLTNGKVVSQKLVNIK